MILLIIVILIFILFLGQRNYEPYQDLNLYAMRLYGSAKHIRLNKFNRVESVYIKPPLPMTGESRCDKVLCPPWIPDTSICYKCI